MLASFLRYVSIGILFGLLGQNAFANLLINPTRVDFHSDTRTVDVTLINTSSNTNTYRLEWVEKKVTETGGYENLTPAQVGSLPIASKMLRVSPRQVTLKPNERQTIKVAIRRPQGLAAGEYRSHLMFRALAPANDNGLNESNQAPSLKFNIVLNFAIPVVVTQGTPQYNLALNNASISYDPMQKLGEVNLSMSRSGTNSVIGNLNAYWTPTGGKETLIAKLGDYNAWPEAKNTTVKLGWIGTGFAKSDGKLRIVYEGTKSFRGKTFFDKTIEIKGGMIKTGI